MSSSVVPSMTSTNSDETTSTSVDAVTSATTTHVDIQLHSVALDSDRHIALITHRHRNGRYIDWISAMELHSMILQPTLHTLPRSAQLSRKASYRQELAKLGLHYRIADADEMRLLKGAEHLSLQAPSSALILWKYAKRILRRQGKTDAIDTIRAAIHRAHDTDDDADDDDDVASEWETDALAVMDDSAVSVDAVRSGTSNLRSFRSQSFHRAHTRYAPRPPMISNDTADALVVDADEFAKEWARVDDAQTNKENVPPKSLPPTIGTTPLPSRTSAVTTSVVVQERIVSARKTLPVAERSERSSLSEYITASSVFSSRPTSILFAQGRKMKRKRAEEDDV